MSIDTGNAVGIRVASLDEIPEGEGVAVDRAVTGTNDDIARFRKLDKLRIRSMLEESSR